MSIDSRAIDTPAADAAKLLCWLGLGLLFVLVPCVGVFSKNAIYVLVPVGASIVLTGTILTSASFSFRNFFEGLFSPLGFIILFAAFWASLSLIWTPFPIDAGERLGKTLAMFALVAAVGSALPERTRPAQLYLLPAGLLLTSALSLGILISSRYGNTNVLRNFSEYDESLFERSILTLIVFIWPAIGALSLRERWMGAAILVVLVAAVAMTGFAQITLAAMGAGAFTFAVAMSGPRLTSRILAIFFAALIGLAPGLPFAFDYGLHAAGLRLDPQSSMAVWAEIVRGEGLRLITGHGFGVTSQALILGFLPLATPKSILFVVWYELGILGGLSFAVLAACAFLSMGRVSSLAAPAYLAGLVTVLTILCLGIATVQVWWINLVGCCIIAYVLLAKGLHRSKRPGAREIQEIDLDASGRQS